MRSLRTLAARLRDMVRNRQLDRDLDDEICAHIDEAVEDFARRDLSPMEARRAALRDFGGITQAREARRAARSFSWIDDLRRDFLHAIRLTRRAPGFSVVVTLTLAVGLGATTAIFSLIDGVLLRPLPVSDPHRLATISSQTDISQGRPAGSGWSYAMWERLRNRAQAFDGVLAWRPARLNLAPRGEMQFVDGVMTTSEYFRTLGVPVILGRTFVAADDRRGGGPGGPVIVISYAFWQRQFGGSGM